jgi:hypothetical protein
MSMKVLRPTRAPSLALLVLAISAGPLDGQGLASLRAEENLRADPQGLILGRLQSGATFPVVSLQGSWVQVEVAGWIWTASLQTTTRGGFDLMVSADPEENLRAEPSGNILGQLVEGTLLERRGDAPGWTQVRRVAWVWRESVELSGAVEAAPRPAAPSQTPAPRAATPEAPATERWWDAGRGGASVLTGPDGDTLARVEPGSELRVLAREGNWIRVSLEGWTWAPQGVAQDSMASPLTVSEATLADVTRDPDSFRGQVVSWELQFVSLERAEAIRTDFYEGEPFLLARTPAPDVTFVYVAVPPDRLGEVEGLIPLERVRVVGRIRTGAAALTGNVILDLMEITRISGE